MLRATPSRLIPILQALFVTFLWSTSFIIIKWGLLEIPPLTFAGLRYFLASICFIPFLLKKKYVSEIKNLSSNQWKKLFLLGLTFYTITQGTQFLGLSLLPSVTVSLILNFTPMVVAVFGIVLINEKPTNLQWLGSLIFLVGILIYFFPVSLNSNMVTGVIVMLVGVLANAFSAIVGRDINRGKNISPLVVTFISMTIGAVILLILGISINGLPALSTKGVLFLLWLAIVNTAIAFTLWNLSLQSLSAIESSIINGTMLIQIAVLAWFFLDEQISPKEGFGMAVAFCGAILVQIRKIKMIKKDT